MPSPSYLTFVDDTDILITPGSSCSISAWICVPRNVDIS